MLKLEIPKLLIQYKQYAYIWCIEFSSPDNTEFSFVFHSTSFRVSIVVAIVHLSWESQIRKHIEQL